MDIAGVSMALNQINAQSAFGVEMLSKSLDLNESMGNGMVDMIQKSTMEQSVNPHIGGNFDMSV